jgi:hypothetical protein
MPVRDFYRRHFDDPVRERGLFSALGFTTAFATARGITHAIRAGVGPFQNISAGGRHIHHSTFGILGLLGIGYLWVQQIFIGADLPPRWGSRLTAAGYGVAAALTMDEFALWLDLHDDYWDAQGRKSIDAVIIFAGLLSAAVAGREALEELGLGPRTSRFLSALDIHSGSGEDGAGAGSPAPAEHDGKSGS